MTVQVVGYDRPSRLATSVRSSYMDVDGTLTFAPAGADGTRAPAGAGGTRMR